MITTRVIPIIVCALYGPIFAFLFCLGIVLENPSQVWIFFFAFFCLLAICYRLWKEAYLPKIVLGISGTLMSLLWLIQSYRRIEFIIREGGIERADGYGSPVAFLANMVIEAILLAIPAIILFIIVIFHKNPTKTHQAPAHNSAVF